MLIPPRVRGSAAAVAFAHVSFWWMKRTPLNEALAIRSVCAPSPAKLPGVVGMNASRTSTGRAGFEMSIVWAPPASHVGSRKAVRYA